MTDLRSILADFAGSLAKTLAGLRKPGAVIEPALVDAETAAAILSMSRNQFDLLVKANPNLSPVALPAPCQAMPRWKLATIREWVDRLATREHGRAGRGAA